VIPHDHEDITQVVIGCRACIERVRAQEEVERWAQAPVHSVEFVCSYDVDPRSGEPARLSFTLELGIPTDAKQIEIETEYAADIGDAFLMALPFDSVPIQLTDWACETMEVDKITIGPVVAPIHQTVPDDQPPLFEV
jgi:hypothetical protein